MRFVDEEALSSPDSLKDCRVLYISAPDLPAECVEGVLRWVSDGGTLVTVAGTGLFDRYHQPAQMLARASGIAVKAPLRPLVDEDHAGAVAAITDAGGLTAMGPLEELTLADARPVAHFSHGAAAVTDKALGQGRIIHFAIFPGFSYVKNGNDAWRQMIVRPVHDAAVALPATVNVTKVEALVLYLLDVLALRLQFRRDPVLYEVFPRLCRSRPQGPLPGAVRQPLRGQLWG